MKRGVGMRKYGLLAPSAELELAGYQRMRVSWPFE
jgi:hypothetical protein